MRKMNERLFDFLDAGFSAFSGRPDPGQRHRHNEVELVVFEHEGIEALYGDRQMTVPPGRLVALWGAMPHRALRVGARTAGHGIRIPLPWVLQWKLPEAFVRRLLHFDVIVSTPRDTPARDLDLVKEWARLLAGRTTEQRELVLLEAHARLLRLALATRAGTRTRGRSFPEARFGLFERILKIVSERYREPLTIPEIARALRVSRTHVMRQFRKVAGMTILDYLTQRRVSCAQRLLTTTDRKMIDIAYEAGFNSATRFYACFKRLIGISPARYRRRMQRPGGPAPRGRRSSR